jgi:two-component system, chemotaxis family, chemotaxis protein CheY
MAEQHSGPFRVLVVDDSLLARKVVAATLEGSEFEIVGTADDGDQAVEAFKEHAPDLVLLDLVMDKQTGKEALEKIIGLDPGARVVMITSVGTDDAVTECMRAGAKMFVQKPFEKTVLLETLRAVCG